MEKKKRLTKINPTLKSNKILSKGWIKNNKKIIVFLAKFFAIFIILETLINLIDLSLLTNLLASVIAPLFNLPYLKNVIFTDSSHFVISNSCTGLVSLAILIAITLPLKAMELKKRIGIIVIGAIFLLLLNIPRIALVILASMNGFNAELVHELTWFLMSVLILIIWYYGIKLIQKEKDFSKLI